MTPLRRDLALPPRLLDLVREDVAATMGWPGPRTARYWLRAVAKLVLNARVRAVVLFRISHALARHGMLPVGLLLRSSTLRSAGCEIHPLATVGPGLLLVHSSGVVIGQGVVIGARCRVHQGATLGEPSRPDATDWPSPTIGDDVVIGAHAVVLGAVTVGDGAVIGANAVVTRDVAPGAVVGGIPARPLHDRG